MIDNVGPEAVISAHFGDILPSRELLEFKLRFASTKMAVCARCLLNVVVKIDFVQYVSGTLRKNPPKKMNTNPVVQ